MEPITNYKLVGIACAKIAIKELIASHIPITPMIIGHEMFSLFDQYSDQELWKKADQII